VYVYDFSDNAEMVRKEIMLYAEDEVIYGDVNGDGAISVQDVVMLQKWLLHKKNAKLTNFKAADLNNDGIVDVYDLGLLKRKLVSKK
jgi:hypothetical protein